MITPASILVRLEHVVLILRDLWECDRDGLAAVLKASDLVLGCDILRHILLHLAVHLLVSLLALSPHIAAANEEAHEENKATATRSCIDNPLREQRFLTIAECGSGAKVGCFNKQIRSSRISNVLGVPRVSKFVSIIFIGYLFYNKTII